ncbi:MAG: hypothetical protein LR015_06625 [Verrucomicrobia bacterium]|nr:hypothetical protein [Verrucomicrobiota bacterium]
MHDRVLHVAGPDQFLPPARQIASSLGHRFWQIPKCTFVRGARAAFREQLTSDTSCVVFHDGWGVEFLATTASQAQRAIYLHTRFSFLDRAIPQWLRFAGTIFLHSPALVNRTNDGLRWVPANRLPVLPYPTLAVNRDKAHSSNPIFTIGVAGWLVRDRHRLDLWPDFLTRLQQAGIQFQVKVIGEGRGMRWLRKSLKKFPVAFVACPDTKDFVTVLGDLDVMVTFSLLESDSWAIQQANRLGVAVCYPVDAEQSDPSSLGAGRVLSFPPGDAASAADAIVRWYRGHQQPEPEFPTAAQSPELPSLWDPSLLRPASLKPSSTLPGWLPLNVYQAVRDFWLSGKFR